MKDKDILANPDNVKFADLLKICTNAFGMPENSGQSPHFQDALAG
jgi:hypothetical protein